MARNAMVKVAALLLTAGVLVAVGLQAFHMFEWSDQRLVNYRIQRIADLEDAAAAEMVRRLEPDSAAAIEELVMLALSERQAVAQAAQRRLEDWAALLHPPPGNYGARSGGKGAGGKAAGTLVHSLAVALARQVEHSGPHARQWAQRLTRNILDCTRRVSHDSRLSFIRACEDVLSAPAVDTAIVATPLPSRYDGAALADRQTLPPATFGERMLRIAFDTGSSPEAVQPPFPSEESVPEEHALAEDSAPVTDASTQLSNPFSAKAEGTTATGPTAFGPDELWQSSEQDTFARVQPMHESDGRTVEIPPPNVTQDREEALRRAPLAAVIEAMESADRFEAGAAEAALRARGMSDADIQLARQLTRADARTRLAIIDALSGWRGVSMVAWLDHFTRDESVEVRLRAFTLLATSGNPALVRSVQERAMRDEDRRVRALAERLDHGHALR